MSVTVGPGVTAASGRRVFGQVAGVVALGAVDVRAVALHPAFAGALPVVVVHYTHGFVKLVTVHIGTVVCTGNPGVAVVGIDRRWAPG